MNMGEEGSSSRQEEEEEVCLSEKSCGGFLNSDGDGDINSPSDKMTITPASSTVDTPTKGAAATETTKDDSPPPVKPSKKRGGGGSNDEAGGGEHDNIHILTERERRKRMRDMFANLHALLPQLPIKADKSSIVDEAVRYIKKLQGDLQSLEKRKQERLQFQSTNTAATVTATATSFIPSSSYISSREAAAAAALYLGNDHQGSSSSSSNYLIPSANSSLNSSPVRFPVAFQIWTSPNVVLTLCGVEAQFNICSPKKFGLLSAIFFVFDKYDIHVMAANISSLNHHCINYMIQAQARGGQDQSLELFSLEDIYRQAALEIMEWTSS